MYIKVGIALFFAEETVETIKVDGTIRAKVPLSIGGISQKYPDSFVYVLMDTVTMVEFSELSGNSKLTLLLKLVLNYSLTSTLNLLTLNRRLDRALSFAN